MLNLVLIKCKICKNQINATWPVATEKKRERERERLKYRC